MARRFTCGCEEADLTAMWDTVDTYGVENQVGIFRQGWLDQVNWSPRTGKGMYVMCNQESVRNLTPDNPTELYFGFALRQKQLGGNTTGFLYIYTDAPGVYANYTDIWMDDFGCIIVKRTGTEIARSRQVLLADTWYYIEVYAKPRNSGGSVIVKVDGTVVIDFTGDTTNDLEVINGYQFMGVYHVDPYLTAFDDIVVNDTSGSVNNSWPGVIKLLPIRPRAAGNYSQWSRGGVDLGSDAAQLRNGTFNFSMLQTSGSGNKVTVDSEVPDIPTNAIIKNIVVTAKARMTSGSGYIAPMVRSGSTDDMGISTLLTTAWKHYQKAWDKNPADSLAWEESDLATLEIGVSS